MATHTPAVKRWARTSSPAVTQDRGRGKWRLRLSYTASTKEKTVRVQSTWFDTREEAEGTASWWRLSFEQGNNGERINPHTHPDQVPAAAAANLPPGELS